MPTWVKTALWIFGGYIVLMYGALPEICDKFGIFCPLATRFSVDRSVHYPPPYPQVILARPLANGTWPPQAPLSQHSGNTAHTSCPLGTSWNSDTRSCIGYFRERLPVGYDGWQRTPDDSGRFRVKCVANCP